MKITTFLSVNNENLGAIALTRRFWRVPTIYVFEQKMKISEFLSENFQCLVVKFSMYLNKRVFVLEVFHVVWKQGPSHVGSIL